MNVSQDSAKTGNEIFGHLVVAVVTHDHTKIMIVHDGSHQPVLTVRRPGNFENKHRGPAQEHHLHHLDPDDEKYYKVLLSTIKSASEIMLVGHGTGDSNAMEGFAEYFRDHAPQEFRKVSEMRNANIPALTDGEILKLARFWKEEGRNFA